MATKRAEAEMSDGGAPPDNPRRPAAIRANAPVDTVAYLCSVIPSNRLDHLEALCRRTLLECPGHVLEVGVYRGGSLLTLARAVKEQCPQYRVIGIDTFRGHPYTDGHPVHPVGKFSDVDIAILREALARAGFSDVVELHQGRVESVLDSLGLCDVAFAHIDCDLYDPVRYCAERLPLVMKPGGVIYFDDYGHEHCPGATRAVLERFPKGELQEVFMPDDGTCWSCHVRVGGPP
jgi:predicted O-methyltransferase YrrM